MARVNPGNYRDPGGGSGAHLDAKKAVRAPTRQRGAQKSAYEADSRTEKGVILHALGRFISIDPAVHPDMPGHIGEIDVKSGNKVRSSMI